MKTPSGFILYEGPSPLNQIPIVIILTLSSRNSKTGDMSQTYTPLQHESPLTGIYTGSDSAVCGQCPHRGVWDSDAQKMRQRSCYVDVSKSVQNVWRAYKRGSYPHARDNLGLFRCLLQGRSVRWGAYGEAVLLPQAIFESICRFTVAQTGYTHLWRDPRFAWARPFVHASCDSVADHHAALAAGWKPFTVIAPEAEPPPATRQCPATLEGSPVQCRSCLGCSGASGTATWTYAHGRGAKYFVPA